MTTIPPNTSDNVKHRETRFLSTTQSAHPVFSRGSPGALCLEVRGFLAPTAAGLGTRPHGLSPGRVRATAPSCGSFWAVREGGAGDLSPAGKRRTPAEPTHNQKDACFTLEEEFGKKHKITKVILAKITFSQSDFYVTDLLLGFPGSSSGEPTCQSCRRHQRHEFNAWAGKSPWGRAWPPSPVFLPGESPWTEEPGGLYRPWGCKSQTRLNN